MYISVKIDHFGQRGEHVIADAEIYTSMLMLCQTLEINDWTTVHLSFHLSYGFLFV